MALIARIPQATQPRRPHWSALARRAHALVYTGRGLVEIADRGPQPSQTVATTVPFRGGAYLLGRGEDTPNRLGRWNIAPNQPASIPGMTFVVRLMRANVAQNGYVVAWGELATATRCHVLITQTTFVVSLRQAQFDTPRVETYSLDAGNTHTWAVRAAPGVGIEVYRDGVLQTPSGTSGTMPASSLFATAAQPVWMGGVDDFSVLGAHFGSALWFSDLGSEVARGLSADMYGVLHEPQRILVPVAAGGGSLLDLAGSQTASLTGAITATGDLQYAINLAGAQTASLSGALIVSGDIQITPAPTLDLSGSQTAALSGLLSASGDLQYTLPVDLSQSAAAALSGSLAVTGDLEYSTAIFLDISAQPVALLGTFAASGDLDPYPSLSLTGAQNAALSGSVTASGDLQYTIPFSITQTGATALSGTLALSGDLEYSTTPLPPPASPGWGGGAVGGGGKGLRELTARIAKDAEDLLERKRKAPNAQISQPAALEPAPVPTRKTSSRGAGSSESVDRVAAEPAVPGSQAEVLFELRLLRGAVEKLEALILADREEARKRREQDEEEAAVVKLLLN